MVEVLGQNLALLPLLRAAFAVHLVRAATRDKKQAAVEVGALGALLAGLSLMQGGPRHNLINTILGTTWRERAHVTGYVAPGFEGVKEAFLNNVRAGFEVGAQFVVYHRGVKVVDLCGGTLPESEYNENTLQLCFSSSKVLAAIVVAMCVDRGLIDYAAPVAQYWPEFAQNGKADITVAEVLRHQSGLAYFREKLPVHMAGRDRMDELAEFIASEPPIWEYSDLEPAARLYHGTTRGFILNEIVRRVDPQGRTIGQVIKDEFADARGLNVHLGPTRSEQEKLLTRKLEFDAFHHTAAKSVWATLTGTASRDDLPRARAFFTKGSHVERWMNCISYDEVPYTPDNFFNHDHFCSDLEIPSVNMVSNARSLAAVADLMSRGELLSPETQAKAHDGEIEEFDHGILLKTRFNQGGWNKYQGRQWDQSVQGFVGWGGFGGSQVAWHPEQQTGIAYTISGPQFSSIFGFRDPRCLNLMRALAVSIRRAERDSAKPVAKL